MGAVAAWLADATAAEATYDHISTWDTSGVTDMADLFCVRLNWMEGNSRYKNCNLTQGLSTASFNEDIGAWDVSGVTDMSRMFRDSSAFNRDIGDWAVHSVTDMSEMFYGASADPY